MGIIDFEDRTRWIRDYNIAKTCTPIKIARDMVSLIDEKYFNPDSKFLDIYCKSGTILEAIKDRLMDSKSMIEAFPSQRDRYYHVLEHQIYGLVWEDVGINCEEMSNINVFGTYVNSNIKIFKIASKNKKDAYKLLDNITFFKDEIQKIFGEKDMKFNIVVGNPPYNSDAYIPFVELGHQLSTECSAFITPARWQGKGGDKNESFRHSIVPHMKKIVYYPDCGDIFKIGECSGIAYYICDKKNTYEIKNIRNKCLTNTIINKEVNRKFDNMLSCYGDTIISKIDRSLNLTPDVEIKEYNYVITPPPAIGGQKGGRSFLFGNSGMLQVLKKGIVCKRQDADYYINGSYKLLCSSDNIDVLKSKLSYCYSKFIRFCILYGMITQSILTEETWRFVPQPGDFDHIFTDEELYKKYALTQDEINTIESIIKEREQI